MENPEPVTFEAGLKELDEILERLERGDLALERGVELYERGLLLARDCATLLTAAEQRVTQLVVHEDGSETEEPFPREAGGRTE